MKMQNRKQILGLFLAALMFLQIMPMVVFADYMLHYEELHQETQHINGIQNHEVKSNEQELSTEVSFPTSAQDEEYIPYLEEWYEYLQQQGLYPGINLRTSFGFDEANEAIDMSTHQGVMPFSDDPGILSPIRYNVLVIDVSGSMAGTPMVQTRIAAQRFVDAALEAEGINYVAIVSFGSSETVLQGFTADRNLLTNAIGNLHAPGNTAMNA